MGCGASIAPAPDPPAPAAAVPELCRRPGCSKKTWDGQPGYCSKGCKSFAENPSGNVCSLPGCGKPTWNGKPGEFCSKTCRAAAAGGDDNKAAPKKGVPGRVAPLVPIITELDPGDPRYQSVHKQYTEKWDTSRCPATDVRAIYEVVQKKDLQDAFEDVCRKIGHVPVFGHGQNPGNVQRRFHGTRLTCDFQGACCEDPRCSVCQIIEFGFSVGKLGSWSGNKGHYGGGIYFTSMSSTAKGYGLDKDSGFSFQNGNWMKPNAGNAVFVSLIACGRVENVDDHCADPVDASQYESRKIKKSTGVDELVVFDGKQTLLRYLIVF